jgi:hypothetical protein
MQKLKKELLLQNLKINMRKGKKNYAIVLTAMNTEPFI